jgi:hypothetical protein
MRSIFLITLSLVICFTAILSSHEQELDANKIELIEVSASDIRLVCFFKNATITTYFRKSPRKNFFFSAVPTHQEFLYHPNKQVLTSTKYESRLWNDGVAGYAFEYENIEMNGDSKKFKRIYTTINDQFAKYPFQARYTLSGEPSELKFFNGSDELELELIEE